MTGKCRVCRSKVSQRAETCPACGEPNPYEPAETTARPYIYIAAVLLTALILGGWWYSATAQLKEAEQQVEDEGQKASEMQHAMWGNR